MTFSDKQNSNLRVFMDNGEMCSLFDEFLRKFDDLTKVNIGAFDKLSNLLPYMTNARTHSDDVMSLNRTFMALPPEIRNTKRMQSVIEFIFYSNSIEDVGAFTISDTKTIIEDLLPLQSKKLKDGRDDRDVKQHYQLLRETYKENCTISDLKFSVKDLKHWHQILLSHDSNKTPGEFRTNGVSTFRDKKEKEKYNYPHHAYVTKVMDQYCEAVNRMLELLDKIHEEPKHLCCTIAIAAFAQFHFVTLHPFKDGNGRLCRYIAKRILDLAMPLTIPMFIEKDEYYDALIKGQKLNEEILIPGADLFAPCHLFILILKSTIDYMTLAVKQKLRKCFAFTDIDDLRSQLHADICFSATEEGAIVEKAKSISAHSSGSIEIDPWIIHLAYTANLIESREREQIEPISSAKPPIPDEDDFN